MSPPSLREAVVIVLGLLGFGAGVLAGYVLSGGDVGCFLGEDTMDVLAAIVSGTVVAVVAQWIGYWLMGKRGYRDLVRTKRLERLLHIQDAATTVRQHANYWQTQHQAELALYQQKHDELYALELSMESRYPGMRRLIQDFLESANGLHNNLVANRGIHPDHDKAAGKMHATHNRLRACIDDRIDSGRM